MILRNCPACNRDSGGMESRGECFYCGSTREGCQYLESRGFHPPNALEALRTLTQIGGICIDAAKKYYFTVQTSDENPQ